MLRFRIGRIPVEVHPGHFLLAGLLGADLLQGPEPAVHLVLWIAVVFFSVLLHELGHATVGVLFGYRPSIQLVWTGGVTRYSNAGATIPWQRQVLLTLAGPGAGLLFGTACILAERSTAPSSGYLQFVLANLIWVNIVWSLINLAPVPPMDGGTISNAVLTRLFGRRGFLFAQIIALVICAAGIAWLLTVSRQSSYTVVLLLIFGLRAFGGVTAYLRGEIPDPNSAALIPFRNAQILYKQGQLPSAKKLAEQALEAAASEPKLQSQIHHLLGWIAVKEGNGRAALDHFSQVQGQTVEPHALAASFSLIGDEARAIPLWEQAYSQSRDPTVLHEWAGALIRDHRAADARRLPGVDMSLAYTCAERVLFVRGEFAAAARVGLAALDEYPSADAAYDVACAMARAGDGEGAIRLLDRAAALGFQKRAAAASDPDLASLHSDPRFQDWLSRLHNSGSR
jgi:tetratricopeptide (TPR) repeat protein